METIKSKKSPLCFLFDLLGMKVKKSYIQHQAKKRFGSKEITFNGDIKNVKSILFVIPDNLLGALYQVENLLSIMSKYEKSDFFLLTGKNCTPWFKQFHGIKNLFEYDGSETCFFKSSVKELKNELRSEHFDICFILDKDHPIILDFLLTQIDADYRVTYDGNSEFPYSNVRIKGKDDTHAVDKNLAISRALKIPLHDKLHWSVSSERVEEIGHILKEHGIKSSDKAACIDIDYFVNFCGKKWTEELVRRLKSELSQYFWYAHVDNADNSKYADWLRSLELPCFYGISPTRIAALLHKSELLVSGKSYLFELAFLLKKKAFGIFAEGDFKTHCRNKDKSKGISISDKADDDTISELIKNLPLS